jgi:hypothetical protein
MFTFGIFQNEKCITQVANVTYRNAWSAAFSKMRELSRLTKDEFESKVSFSGMKAKYLDLEMRHINQSLNKGV